MWFLLSIFLFPNFFFFDFMFTFIDYSNVDFVDIIKVVHQQRAGYIMSIDYFSEIQFFNLSFNELRYKFLCNSRLWIIIIIVYFDPENEFYAFYLIVKNDVTISDEEPLYCHQEREDGKTNCVWEDDKDQIIKFD